ncbi:hypothetical protein [Methanococcoides methylutens]|uniref:Uncharacterized protein n=1 Tax=Methanococcoides methylutens MM1 TaxID=1434104 RepID=A0A0E3X074_METMT|nr:hypothetical protein [Methanococcoides methylutens]AKB84990.1 hypothetical protein MCMEM_0937 [Methanococcoides methylutens MM1]
MDIDGFIKKQESAVNKYHRIYKILDFSIIALISFSLLKILKIDLVLFNFRTFELYADSTYGPSDAIPAGSLLLAGIAIFTALILTIAIHFRDKKVQIVPLIEEKFPSLKERLRTANDNKNIHNIIVDELMGNVLDIASKVNTSELLEKKRFKASMALLVASLMIFAFVNVTDYRSGVVDPEDLAEIIGDLPGMPGNENATSPDESFTLDSDGGSGGEEDLMGEPAIIVVEGEEVDLSLPPGAGTGFTAGEEGEEQPPEFESSSAYEVGLISSPAYYEQLPEGYENLIKEYFEEMTKN